MLTPEQLASISFGKKFGGGYNTEEVDAFISPLVADYITLYNENTSMRTKMRVLVTKLEEYRSAETSMKEAVINTQKACDAQISDTKVKCALMIRDAEAAAIEADEKIAAEEARVEQARILATKQIVDLQKRLESCLQLLCDIRENHRPSRPIEEIIAEMQPAPVAVAPAPAAPPAEPEKQPVFTPNPAAEKFANLQFGRNYDPDKR